MVKKNVAWNWILAFGVMCVLGCGPQKEEYKVTGEVTVDGEPVDRGSISFVPEDGTGATGGGIIEDGKYEAMVPPGDKIVKVSGFRVTGQGAADPDLNPDQKVDLTAPMTGKQYNSDETPLRATIEGDAEGLDFDLDPGGVPSFATG
ncbi:MAG: hypothetical protein ACQESR_05460 [Planctomycetota bacterium]